jgi:uncharacterized damage-inducible protein DinB
MDDNRTDPAMIGNELEVSLAYLDYHRDTLAWKTSGLTQEQLAQALAPSTMTLGGLLKHLAVVEDSWFTNRFAGQEMPEPWASVDWDADWDWEWHTAADDSPEELRELWQASVSRSRAAIAGHDLDAVSVKPTRSGHFNLRWVVLHMIEEYARHNGHADLIRESIDGQTGE